MNTTVVWLRDRFVGSPEEARVSLFDRGYLFGDSIFETLRAYAGSPFAVDAHLDRLEHASRVTGIAIPRARQSLSELIAEAVRRSGLSNAYIRVSVSRGEGGSGLGTVGCDDPVLSIIVRELVPYPIDAYEHGIETTTLGLRKVPADCLDPRMKTGNYLPNILGKRELERLGLVEGVMLSTTGMVVSGTVSNLFLVENDTLRTPDETSGCRPGVTREVVLGLAAAVGLRPAPGPISSADLTRANEACFTNTLMECLPIRRLDGHALDSVSPGSATRRLQAAFRREVDRASGSSR